MNGQRTGPHKYGAAHQRTRALALKRMVEGTPCPFCGLPMSKIPVLDARGRKRVLLDWDHTTKSLSHPSCNRAHGARSKAANPPPAVPAVRRQSAVERKDPGCRDVHVGSKAMRLETPLSSVQCTSCGGYVTGRVW